MTITSIVVDFVVAVMSGIVAHYIVKTIENKDDRRCSGSHL